MNHSFQLQPGRSKQKVTPDWVMQERGDTHVSLRHEAEPNMYAVLNEAGHPRGLGATEFTWSRLRRRAEVLK